jgi:hypothetical protein
VRQPIHNFGGNIHFTPRHFYTPTSEAEVLAILDRHAQDQIRVVGALHSWSPAAHCADAIIDLRHLDTVTIDRDSNGAVWATVGGGCRIKHLLRKLHYLADVTLPSLGLITEQTIAGAIATGTHGSGKHSMSHYVAEVRMAAYDAATGKARVFVLNEGAPLRSARCALGCLGVVLAVRFRCVPRFDVAETIVSCASLDEVLAVENDFPLQQFYLIPHRWSYYVHRRSPAAGLQRRRGWLAQIYQGYCLLGIDIALHVMIVLLAVYLKSATLVRFFFRHVLGKLILTNQTVVDHADRMLVMEHELFQHLEMEIFVPASQLRQAAAFVRVVLEVFDGQQTTIAGQMAASLQAISMKEDLEEMRGACTFHYPITFRKVLPDDTLISMSSGTAEPYYAISFITYAQKRDEFFVLASFLARSMTRLFQARLHWGKYFPMGDMQIEAHYPQLAEFRAICARLDPNGVFRNSFVDQVLFADQHSA